MLDALELRKIADNHLKAAELSFDAESFLEAINHPLNGVKQWILTN